MIWRNKAVTKRVLVVLFIMLLAGFTAQAVYINAFNQHAHVASGADDSQETYLDLHNRMDSTSSWVKRDFNLNGETLDLLAQTVDGTFYNNAADRVESWVMTITVEGDCLINNAWCGTVEIHQYVGTDKEAVQTLDLRDYDIEEVELDYLYDGDLLIPLSKGDYLVYYPSEKDDELQIAPHTEMTMGMIFYFRESLDLANYEIEYYYHRDLTYGAGFVALVIFAVLWVLLLAGLKVADLSYKRAMKEMELRKSGLASMSSIYSVISFIDLEKDQLTHVYADEKTTGNIPNGSGAREKIRNIFDRDTAEPYREIVLEFVDLSTLPQRMERESIACEYVSKAFGWSMIRFFAAGREEGKPLDQVIFTIQDINEEKRELERFEERADQAEFENRARNAFVMGVSHSMKPPLQTILELAGKISSETDEEPLRSYARQIEGTGRMLSFMIDNALDSSKLAAGTMERTFEEYSFRTLIEDVRETVDAMAQTEVPAFDADVPATIPERLVGDSTRIARILVGILAYATRRCEPGNVKLSVYGKSLGNVEHLLFSVHMSGCGIPEKEANDLASFVAGLEEGASHTIAKRIQELEVAAVLLAFMQSKLHVVNEPDEGCEFYFEIEQDIAGQDAGQAAGQDAAGQDAGQAAGQDAAGQDAAGAPAKSGE